MHTDDLTMSPGKDVNMEIFLIFFLSGLLIGKT